MKSREDANEGIRCRTGTVSRVTKENLPARSDYDSETLLICRPLANKIIGAFW
jgi:hypothetical protein